jgi:hypothetical protein
MYWMQTYSGRKVDLKCPQPKDIYIDDIAHALSMMCRFGGHCKNFYSVAEHSLLVERVVALNLPDTKTMNLAALLHDAAEAYLGDVISPLKKLLAPKTVDLEGLWLDAIRKRFELPMYLQPLPSVVHEADAIMLKIEVFNLFDSVIPEWGFQENKPTIPEQLQPKCLSPAEAREAFLKRYYELNR